MIEVLGGTALEQESKQDLEGAGWGSKQDLVVLLTLKRSKDDF